MSEIFRARVKPLEWYDYEDRSSAFGSVVEYEVCQFEPGRWAASTPPSDARLGAHYGDFSARETAKAACEEDNERSVKELLEIVEESC